VSETFPGPDLLRSGPNDADWNDVLRRARQGRRRRHASAIVVLIAAVAVGIASAYAFGHPIIDFGSAPKGPTKVVNDFGSLQVGAPPGMAPGVLPHEARRITTVAFDGKQHVLWVAPTKQGGFCEQWSGSIGGCRANRHDKFAKRLDVSSSYTAKGSLTVLGGSFFQSAGARLEVSYADGASAEIPFVWVTAPIDAGFYLYRVPDAHRVRATRPAAVSLLDDDGKVLAREPIRYVFPPDQISHRVAGYPPLSVPAEAIWERRRQLFDERADDGERVGLWVAPKRGGGTCFWTNQASGCSREGDRKEPPSALELGFSGGATRVTLCCAVGPQVARVEARFQDGDRIDLFPKESYRVWPIPSRHYPRGRRLDQLIAFDATGRQVAAHAVKTNTPGLYPCAKPKQYGYGVSMCP
jgi:hypothetical protein